MVNNFELRVKNKKKNQEKERKVRGYNIICTERKWKFCCQVLDLPEDHHHPAFNYIHFQSFHLSPLHPQNSGLLNERSSPHTYDRHNSTFQSYSFLIVFGQRILTWLLLLKIVFTFRKVCYAHTSAFLYIFLFRNKITSRKH